jgi:hypothetical protein
MALLVASNTRAENSSTPGSDAAPRRSPAGALPENEPPPIPAPANDLVVAPPADPAPPVSAPAPTPSLAAAPAPATPTGPPPQPIAERTTNEPLSAESLRRFGDRDELVLSGSFDVSLGRLGYSDTDSHSFAASFAPAFDYFVVENVTFGGSIVLRYYDEVALLNNSVLKTSATTYGAGVRVGYNIPFGEVVSWWLRGGVFAWRQRSKQSADYGASIVADGTSVAFADHYETAAVFSIYAPLLVHPTSHLFLGFGPDIYTDFSHSVAEFENRRTFWGLSSVLGGWL